VPLFGEYDDYGGITNITKNEEVVFMHLSGMIAEIKELEKENRPQDIYELINTNIERGEYEHIGFMMVREDIYTHLMNTYQDKRLRYEKDAQRFVDSYTAKKRDIEEEVEDIRKEYRQNPMISQEEMERKISRLTLRAYDFYEFGGRDNYFTSIYDSHSEGLYTLRSLLWRFAETNDRELKEALIDLAMMTIILHPLRKFWSIQPGAGSQNEDVKLHKALANQMLQVINKIETRWDDDEEDED
jgi:hypothetical protein